MEGYARPRRAIACDNMNHRRAGAPGAPGPPPASAGQTLTPGRAAAPVAHCPQCGEVVNSAVHPAACTEAAHAAARRRQCAFCVDCGRKLITAR